MLQDINLIRKELEGYEEIEFPYPLKPGIIVKYITVKDDEESFFTGGKFVKMGNETIYLTNGGPTWKVPIKVRDDECNIQYKSRFFIPSVEDVKSNEVIKFEKIIKAQQDIIEKMTETIKNDKIQLGKYISIITKLKNN